MTGQELATTKPATTLATVIAQAGVEVVEVDGVRRITFPDNLRERFNVLMPVDELVQANPLWSPGLKAVTLTIDEHTYKGQKDSEAALNKAGVMLLARTAGVEVVSTERLERSRLKDAEIGWQATVRTRRSDGTWETAVDSRVMDIDEERAAIEHQVRSAEAYYAKQDNRAPKSEAVLMAAVKGRWTNERPHFDAKCETKAILRAMRHLVGIPHAFPKSAFTKPFLVVTYSLTPDYDDPETMRMLLAEGIGATQRAFPIGTAQGELPPAPEPEAPGGAQEPPAAAPETSPPAESAAAPAAAEPDGSGADAAKFAEAERYVVQMGKHRGKTIAQLASAPADGEGKMTGMEYLRWLAGREATTHPGRMLKDMIVTYLEGAPK